MSIVNSNSANVRRAKSVANVAHDQWARRPVDERFETLGDVKADALGDFQARMEPMNPVPLNKINAEIVGSDMKLIGPTGAVAALTNWSMGQLCGRIGADQSFLSKLGSTDGGKKIAAMAVTELLSRSQQDAKFLFSRLDDGTLLTRSMNGAGYGRIWDWEVIDRCMQLEAEGWRVPPGRPVAEGETRVRPATEADVLSGGGMGLSIKVGDMIAPAGIYRGDRDLFIIMIDHTRPISDGTPFPLYRMIISQNSEVGAAKYKHLFGLLKGICGNHILHGLAELTEVSTRHVGKVRDRVEAFDVQIRRYLTCSSEEQQGGIKEFQRAMVATTKEELLDTLFGRKIATRKQLESAYSLAEQREDWYGAPPLSKWGISNGLTELATKERNGDERLQLDLAAQRVLTARF